MQVHPTRPNLNTSVLKWKRVSGIAQVTRRISKRLAFKATPEIRVVRLLDDFCVILSLLADHRREENSIWLTQRAVTTPRDRPVGGFICNAGSPIQGDCHS